MKTRCAFAAGVVALLCACGCGGGGKPTFEALANDQVKVINEAADVLNEVKDEATAKAAVLKLQQLGARFQELKKAEAGLGKMSPEDQVRFTANVGAKMAEATAKLTAQTMRVTWIPAAKKELNEALKAFNQK